MSTQRVYIYGTGGHAAEASWVLQLINQQASKPHYEIIAYIDDNKACDHYRNKPVLRLNEANPAHVDGIICAIGLPHTREKVVAKCLQAGFQHFPNIHAPSNLIADDAKLANGILSYWHSSISTNTNIGQHVHINKSCSISHDVSIGDFSTLSPDCHVCGNVQIGKRVFIGAGAVIINGTPEAPLIIGDDCVIAAGACVINNLAPQSRVFGVPAKIKN